MPKSPLNLFEEFLKEQGKRLTVGTRLIVETVFRLDSPIDADRVMSEIGRVATECRVSRSTVFRTLQDLEESGLITKQATSSAISYAHCFPAWSRQMKPAFSQCEATHAKFIIGRCPWCGCDIVNGA